MDKKIKIMVVEDEQSLREAITLKLESLNFEVVGFESGREAIDYLIKLNPNQLPSLIWLDFYVKDLNGLGFMMELKQHNDLLNIPVIVVSNSASPAKVQQMLDLGAKKYILKAENKLDDIVETVKGLIDG